MMAEPSFMCVAFLLGCLIIQSQSVKYEVLPYEFSYDIRSSDYDNYYGHHQSQDEQGITTGSYYLLSPDGVWRETTFSDKGSGYQAVTKRNPLNSPPSNVLNEDGLAVYFSLGSDDTEGQRSLIGVPVISNSFRSNDQDHSGYQIPAYNKRMAPKVPHNLLKEEENIITAETSTSEISLLPEERDEPQILEEKDDIVLEDETSILPDETKSATLTNEEESNVSDPANDLEISLLEKRSPLLDEEDLKQPNPSSSSGYPISFRRSPLDIKVPEVPLDILSLAYTSPENSENSEESTANIISRELSPKPFREPGILPEESETSEKPIQASKLNQDFTSSSNTDSFHYSTTTSLEDSTDVLDSELVQEKDISKHSLPFESSDALLHIQTLVSSDFPKSKLLTNSQDISTIPEPAPTYSILNSSHSEFDSSHPLSPPSSPSPPTSTPSVLEQPFKINLSELSDKIGNSGISKIIKHLEYQEKNRIRNLGNPKREILYEFEATRQPTLLPTNEQPEISSIAINKNLNKQNKSYLKEESQLNAFTDSDSTVEKAAAYVTQESSKVQNTDQVLMEEITPISKERSPPTDQNESDLPSPQKDQKQKHPELKPVFSLRNYKPGSNGLLQTLNKNKFSQLPYYQQHPNVRNQVPKLPKFTNNNSPYPLPNIDLSKFTKPGEVVNKVSVINLNSPFPLPNTQTLSSTRNNRESIPEAISKLLSHSQQHSQSAHQPKPIAQSNKTLPLSVLPNSNLRVLPYPNPKIQILSNNNDDMQALSLLKQKGFLTNQNIKIIRGPQTPSDLKKIQQIINNQRTNPQQIQIQQLLSPRNQNLRSIIQTQTNLPPQRQTNKNSVPQTPKIQISSQPVPTKPQVSSSNSRKKSSEGKTSRGPQTPSDLKRIQQIINNQRTIPQQIQLQQLLSPGNQNIRSIIQTQTNLPPQRQTNKNSIPQTPKIQISSQPTPTKPQVQSSNLKGKSSEGKTTRIVLPPNHKLVDVLRRLAKERPSLVSTKPFAVANNIPDDRLAREIVVTTDGTSKQNNTRQNSIPQYDPPKQPVKVHGNEALNYGIHPLENSRPAAFIPVSRKENNPYKITLPEQNRSKNTEYADASLVKMKKLAQGVSSLGGNSNARTIEQITVPIQQVKESFPQESEIFRPIRVQITKGQLDGAQALTTLPYSQLHKLLRPIPRGTTPASLIENPPHSRGESSQIGTNYKSFQQFRDRIENSFENAKLNSPPKRAQPSRSFYTPQEWRMGDKNSWIPSQQHRGYNSNPIIFQNARGNHERFLLPIPEDSSDPMQQGDEDYSQQKELTDLEGSYSSPESSYINTRLFLALPPENLF